MEGFPLLLAPPQTPVVQARQPDPHRRRSTSLGRGDGEHLRNRSPAIECRESPSDVVERSTETRTGQEMTGFIEGQRHGRCSHNTVIAWDNDPESRWLTGTSARPHLVTIPGGAGLRGFMDRPCVPSLHAVYCFTAGFVSGCTTTPNSKLTGTVRYFNIRTDIAPRQLIVQIGDEIRWQNLEFRTSPVTAARRRQSNTSRVREGILPIRCGAGHGDDRAAAIRQSCFGKPGTVRLQRVAGRREPSGRHDADRQHPDRTTRHLHTKVLKDLNGDVSRLAVSSAAPISREC